ncbi:hypothetical protein L7F22_045630 [Adiantum nelumboides]|nr:hypothetical protein [Adiantum nelumboides]
MGLTQDYLVLLSSSCGGITFEFGDDDWRWVYDNSVEVYNLEADRWSRVADMPVPININFYYVSKHLLYVGGHTGPSRGFVPKLFSYNPALDQWMEETRQPETLFNSDSSISYMKKIMSIQDSEFETLYTLDICRNQGKYSRHLNVSKLEQGTSEWNLVYEAPVLILAVWILDV